MQSTVHGCNQGRAALLALLILLCCVGALTANCNTVSPRAPPFRAQSFFQGAGCMAAQSRHPHISTFFNNACGTASTSPNPLITRLLEQSQVVNAAVVPE